MLPSVRQRISLARNGKAALARTLRWFYRVHKVGIFVRVRGGRLAEYITFNNPVYKNPMAAALGQGNSRLATALADRPAMWCQYWPQDAGHWRATGKKEKLPTYFNEFLWWWEKAARERRLPDCDLFFNYKDQVVAPLPGRSAHPHLPPSAALQTKRLPGAFVPVLSQSAREGFADVPFLSADDITRVSGHSFPPICFGHYAGIADIPPKPWEERDPRALFRGSATGCGTTPRSNMRLGTLAVAKQHPDLFDVGVTQHRSGAKHYFVNGVRQPRPRKFPPADRVSFSDHGNYRVLLDIDGNVLAYRIAALFAFRAAVVRVAPEFEPWFADLLQAFTIEDDGGKSARYNCARVSDPKDLPQLLQVLGEGDGKMAREIGIRGRQLFDRYLSGEGLLDYTEALCGAFSRLPVEE
jgi:hypothetical protein